MRKATRERTRHDTCYRQSHCLLLDQLHNRTCLWSSYPQPHVSLIQLPTIALLVSDTVTLEISQFVNQARVIVCKYAKIYRYKSCYHVLAHFQIAYLVWRHARAHSLFLGPTRAIRHAPHMIRVEKTVLLPPAAYAPATPENSWTILLANPHFSPWYVMRRIRNDTMFETATWNNLFGIFHKYIYCLLPWSALAQLIIYNVL